MKTLTRACVAGCLAGLASCLAGRAITTSATAVANLTADNFDDFVNSHKTVMVEFFAPWCGVCADLAPIYEATAAELDPAKDIRFASVDCVVSPELCKKYRTPIYPTLRLFQGEATEEIYNGPRTPFEMTSYAERRYRPLVATLYPETIEAFKSSDNVTVVGYFGTNDDKSRALFSEVAKANLDFYSFGTVDNPLAAKAEGVRQPAVILYKQFDEGRVVYDGAFEEEAMSRLLDTAATPLIAELELKYTHRYVGDGALPLAGIFAPTPSERSAMANVLRPIAEKLRERVRFVMIDAVAYRKLTKTFGIDNGDTPTFAIKQLDGTRFMFDPKVELTSAAAESWVADYMDGKLSPYFKSEARPETQDGPVTVVVRDSFQEIVMESGKDVLLEFYAPWCGHCKKFAPDYERLADLYHQHAPDLTIAKVDGSANEISGHPVSSFPTVVFFPAGDKDAGIVYKGDRTMADVAEFVRVNSAAKVDISAFLPRDGRWTAMKSMWRDFRGIGGYVFDALTLRLMVGAADGARKEL